MPVSNTSPITIRELKANAEAKHGFPASHRHGGKLAFNDSETIPPRDQNLPCPLSPSQERIWLLERANPDSSLYNEAEAVRLKGKLNEGALEEAINAIIRRHETLRSTIQVINGIPFTVVHQNWRLDLNRVDLRGLPREQRNAEAERALIEEPRRRFNLLNEPAIRGTVIRLDADDSIFILMMHQIICDGSSFGILWSELGIVYHALLQNHHFFLPPLPIQYADYAVWKRNADCELSDDRRMDFWNETWKGAPKVLDLPTDRPRSGHPLYNGDKIHFSLGPALAEKLRNMSRREGTSAFDILTAALNVLLYRYTGQVDILIGVPIEGRDHPELQSLIGRITEIGILRSQFAANIGFRELLTRIQHGLADIYSHCKISVEQGLKVADAKGDAGDFLSFQVMINWRDRQRRPPLAGLPGLVAKPLVIHGKRAKNDLTLHLTDTVHDFLIEMEYNTALFDHDRIERMAKHFQTLLEAVAADPNSPISALPILTEMERRQILVEWNRTEVEYPTSQNVYQIVEEQARKAPDAIAVTADGGQWTYHQVNARANQLARYLRTLGIGPNKLVGICIGRSLDFIVGLLGVLKAGGAYLPLDPGCPKERLAFMLDDAGAQVLLTHQLLYRETSLDAPGCKVVCLDIDRANLQDFSTENLNVEVALEDLAYVIYTSGSTGEPKGVELKHRGLLNLVFWHRRIYQVTSSDRATQLAGVAFDASVWELWPYLCAGASLHLPNEETRLSPEKLRDWLVENDISLSFVPTPLAEAMIGLAWPSKVTLRVMLTGGDRLTRCPPASLPFLLVNHYGPTENTVVTTSAIVGRESEGTKAPPIGKPIDNIQLYLLDDYLQPVPVGVRGELYIGGVGLAQGYRKHPELTAEKFVSNPFSADPGARLYKTGDLACYSSTGTVHFLGRNDMQIKIRGFRIEPGEIESVLAAYPDITAAAVVARGELPEDKHLVAYVTCQTADLTGAQLRDFLGQKLPKYMVPAIFVALDRLPLTANGKADRGSLPPPDSANTLQDQADVAPISRVEKTLTRILASLLKIENVDREANFFALGGHSLLGTQLIARIRNSFGIELPLREVFDSPTVAALSAQIEEIMAAEVEAMSDEEVHDSLQDFSAADNQERN